MPTTASTGRRKTATARVSLKEGTGQITINGRSFEEYLPQVSHQNQVLLPLQATGSVQKFDVSALVTGGGTSGQVGAIRHALARALLATDAEFRVALRGAGLLTRDPRMKERKKPGQPGARARFQFSKR
ncbi:MAG: 30S ribosomal protein S9 [Verrucomicrobiales bacterium]